LGLECASNFKESVFKGLTKIFMVFDFKSSVKDYAKRGKYNEFPTIEQCCLCQKVGNVIGYGYYSRWCRQWMIWIRRYFCNRCGGTFSLLPSFLCRGIGETLQVVEGIVYHRDQGKSYRESMEASGRTDFSYQRLQYWSKRWKKKVAVLRASLPLKGMKKTLNIFIHLSNFFHRPQDSGELFEAVNRYFSLHFYQPLL
jgi:hypothetical protein